MRKNENGVMVVEASLALTAFMFLVLFFISFAKVYRAQAMVSHATFQTVQSLAIESYTRETIGQEGTLGAITKLSDFVSRISGRGSSALTDSYSSLGNVTNLKGIVSKEFARSIAKDAGEADARLKNLGIVGGLNGIDFADTSIKGSVITITVRYKVSLPFSFFVSKAELPLKKTAQCKSFASIKENNEIKAENKENGS